MSDEKRYTLAEVREKERAAFVRGATLMGGGRSGAEALAHHPGYYPDPEPPEPERRWVYGGNEYDYARESADIWWWKLHDGGVAARVHGVNDSYVRSLASLLPRDALSRLTTIPPVTEETIGMDFHASIEEAAWRDEAAVLEVAPRMTDDTRALIEEARATHLRLDVSTVSGLAFECSFCEVSWPCPTIRLADALEAASKNTERLRDAATAVQCACSIRERESGHRVECWMPALTEALASRAEPDTEEDTDHGK